MDLSDNHLDTITAGSFRNFSKIEEIVIANGRVSSIENGAFEGLHQLLTLNLTNNNLSELKSKVLKSNSNLQFLILSNNKIESWDNFKVSDLVSLLYLDISGNKFTYLPQDILKLLDDHPTFTIVLDDNPWDCNNEILKNSNIAKYICETTVDGSADSVTNQARVEATTVDNSTNDTIGAFQPTSDMPPNVCVVKNRRNLLPIWLALAIVVGIIIGNGDRIYGWVNAKCGRKHVARSKYYPIIRDTVK